jgi:poly-gamma-glutamate capsule biosynthesis protein CapA/YwtB (metallophosphatase superfamily)
MRKQLICLLILFAIDCDFIRPGDKFTITFTGDILLDRTIRRQINRVGIDSIFIGILPILQKSTFVVGNLENPLTKVNDPQNKTYTFKGDPEWAGSLRKAGFTHLDVANNHTYDQGENGFIETIESLKAAKICPVGAIEHDLQINPALLTFSGDTCALFASNLIRPEVNEHPLDTIGPCRKTADSLSSIIKHYRSEHRGHIIIILLHWGREHDKSISSEQRNAAYSLVDAGTDIVIGHHPHILQPIEIYHNKPIIYSLGNFVFDQALPTAIKSMAVQLRIENGKVNKIKIFPIEIARGIPSRTSRSDFVMPLIPQNGESLFKVCVSEVEK